MANIGSFRKSGEDYIGEIVTLKLQHRNVRLVEETRVTGENAPSHRIYIGRVEVGAAWPKTSSDGLRYLSLKLDDPSFDAPIFASLFADEMGEGYTLAWSRPQRSEQN